MVYVPASSMEVFSFEKSGMPNFFFLHNESACCLGKTTAKKASIASCEMSGGGENEL